MLIEIWIEMRIESFLQNSTNGLRPFGFVKEVG